MATKPELGRFHLYEYLVIIEPHKRESGDVVDDDYYNDDDGDDTRYYCNGRPTQHSCPGRDSNPGTREKRYKLHAPTAIIFIIIAGIDNALINQTIIPKNQ
jgi:hypothetical protein